MEDTYLHKPRRITGDNEWLVSSYGGVKVGVISDTDPTGTVCKICCPCGAGKGSDMVWNQIISIALRQKKEQEKEE